MKLTIAFGLTLCTVLVSGLVAPESIGRIFNGQDANQGQFRYLVLLKSVIFGADVSKKMLPCGGSLIHKEWVLTAGHCLYGVAKVTVYLGGIYSDSGQIAYILEKPNITVHPQFNPGNLDHDISLLEIPPTESCDEVSIVPLPKVDAGRAPTYAGTIGVTAGWGRLGEEGPYAERLQWTRVRVMSNIVCELYFAGITRNEMCVSTRQPFGSPCKGDSGGPLVLENTGELIGVASAVDPKGCHLGNPAIFMRITFYLPWIQATTGITL